MASRTIIPWVILAAMVFALPPIRRSATPVSSISCNGQEYVYDNLAGYGFTPSDALDEFGATAGGIGSSAAIDPESWKKDDQIYTGILWALPDRGWNTEGTLNYQPRLHKFAITFVPTVNNSSEPNLDLEYLDTILFVDPSGQPVTGLDPDPTGPYLAFPGFPALPSATYTGDGFGGDGPGGRRVSLDPEGLVLNPDGSFWISDEYGAYIYRFSKRGKMLSAIPLPDVAVPRRNGTVSFSANSPPRYDPDRTVSPGRPQTGRANNQGLEGLTASPDGKTLYALMQSALSQEGANGANNERRYARLFEYDVSTPSKAAYVAEYIVPLPLYDNSTRVAAQSEIKYISSTQFLILARDSGRGAGQSNTQSLYRHADVFDISSATNIKNLASDCANCSIASSKGVLRSDVTPATYCSFVDYNINAQLNRFGLHNGGTQDSTLLNEKWESFALVPVHPKKKNSNEYFLFSLSDNDFITQNGVVEEGELSYADESGFNLNNQVLVFKIKLPEGANPRVG